MSTGTAGSGPLPGPSAVGPSARQLDRQRYIERQLRKTRRQVRGVEISSRLMVLAAAAVAFFLVAAVVDHWLVPGGLTIYGRLAFLAAFLIGAGWFAARELVPLFVCWGVGCALGVKMAWPERPVLGIIGDGSALYGIQALWSAAKYRIPVTFVIPNNAQYQILKIGAAGMDLPAAQQGKFEGFDLTGPEVDFVGLSRSLGVEATRITEPDELSERVSQSLRGDRPQVFEVPITRAVPGRLNY